MGLQAIDRRRELRQRLELCSHVDEVGHDPLRAVHIEGDRVDAEPAVPAGSRSHPHHRTANDLTRSQRAHGGVVGAVQRLEIGRDGVPLRGHRGSTEKLIRRHLEELTGGVVVLDDAPVVGLDDHAVGTPAEERRRCSVVDHRTHGADGRRDRCTCDGYQTRISLSVHPLGHGATILDGWEVR